MAPSLVGLQLLIDICANYGFENDLLFNRSKSICMVVKPRGRNVSTPFMFLNGDALEYVDSVKYLGVVLSQDDMKDDADMSRHLCSLYARSNVIFRKFHHCSRFSMTRFLVFSYLLVDFTCYASCTAGDL